ncbi:MAG: serine protease [Dehalococcoidia bacterium]
MNSPLSPEAFASALVWICDDQGTPWGAGTLVGPSYILTCAHVVLSALKLNTPDAPIQPVHVIFTHASDHRPRLAAVRRDRWFPRPDATTREPSADDMALLVLLEDAPPDATPVPCLLSRPAKATTIRTFGLPLGHGLFEGGWAAGSLESAPQASGWIQINGRSDGYRIQPGFSGAAAWSDDYGGVLGMIVAAERAPDVRVGWMIPAEIIALRCPEVSVDLVAALEDAGAEVHAEPDGSAPATPLLKTLWDWSVTTEGDWIARVERHLLNVHETSLRDLPQEREGLRKGRTFTEDRFAVADKNYRIEVERNRLTPRNTLPIPLRRGMWEQYMWVPQIEPPLPPGARISYIHHMTVPGSEKQAFRSTGTHAGVLITEPMLEGELVLRAPPGFVVELTDTIVRLEDDSPDDGRESRELDRVGRPRIEDTGAVLRWHLEEPHEHVRYQFGYRLVKR